MFGVLTFFKGRQPELPQPEILEFAGLKIRVVRRAYRRRLTLTVHLDGRIQVRASKSTSVSTILGFVKGHQDWLEQRLLRYQKEIAQRKEKEFREGESFLFLGLHRDLRIISGDQARARVELREGSLCYLASRYQELSYQPQMGFKVLRKFYQAEGRRILQSRVAVWAQETGLYPQKLSFRGQRTRWGSCSSKGHISLNWKLVAAPLEVIDYVIIHELAHLEHANHSKDFWHLVARYCPDHKEYRQWLRRHQLELEF